MSNIQCALGEGHMTRHDELLRMEYCNAACMMDCVKPNSFKVPSIECVILLSRSS